MINYFNKRIFAKIGLLFLSAAITLIVSAYYVFDWSFTETDNILDAHDAYYNFKLVESWGSPPNIEMMETELENLGISGLVLFDDLDTLCLNDTITYWSNFTHKINLCNYFSYSDSKDLGIRHNIDFPSYVSFGDYLGNSHQYQMTYIKQHGFIYLLAVDYLGLPNTSLNALPLICLAFIFMFFLYLLVRRFLKPINLIEQRIKALEKGDYSSKIKGPFSQDELGSLSTNLNHLIGEIKKLLNQKERLLSDVSHELRTPLAKIRLLIAMIPEHKKIKEVDKQVKIIDSLITNILLSDKMSSPYSNLNLKKISLVALINEAVEMTFVKNFNIKFLISKNTTVRVDIIKMSVAIKNLLENAYKYSSNADMIQIKVFEENKNILISIIDNGPGIDEKIKQNLTKAFIRGENQPAINQGFGLGLSICKKVVVAHGGSIIIKNNKKSPGSCFTLSFPK